MLGRLKVVMTGAEPLFLQQMQEEEEETVEES